MKKLKELIPCNYDIEIESIEDDSRIKADNYLFCCIKGITVDGHDYFEDAIKNGAVAIVTQKDIKTSVPTIKVNDTNNAMMSALSNFYDNVNEKLKIIGVTGTNGKTTISEMLYQLINMNDNINDKCGLIGTNGIQFNDVIEKIGYTTPFPKKLFEVLNNFYYHNCKYVVMEVSSERLLTKRIDNFKYDVTIFTNLTHDHMNNHKTFKNYRYCKGKLFTMTKKEGYSIINVDDLNANYFKTKANGKVLTYGINNKADFTASDIIISENKLLFNLNIKEKNYLIESPLSGKFNVYNILAVIATCYSLGFNLEEVINNIKKLKPILGRVNIINFNNRFKVVIDYAHTADALKNLLEYVHIVTNGKIITVTGSAGGRDYLKRPDMGKVVTSLSDYVIFTMDDPRHEDPNDIIDEMVSELDNNNYERIIDRALAIKKALSIANDGDVVVIAGRGNDTFIPVGNIVIHCNDYEEVYKNQKKEILI